MRPIPAPRLGDTHGLLRAIDKRGRVRLDEFVTEFSVEELFPPGLENALGRTRQFVSYARAAGLVTEDRGVVELTDLGRRYVRAGDPDRPFEVSESQAEWLRRQLRERHMTDSIFHGAAVALSLYASNPPGNRVTLLDVGRALNHLARAGWDNENTFRTQGERYTTLLEDLELIDGERAITATGSSMMSDLTLPVHMSLRDLAGELNPGGPEVAAAEGQAEWAELSGAGAPAEATGAAPDSVLPPPVPPEDLWETAGPDDATKAYESVAPPKPPEDLWEEPPAKPAPALAEPAAVAEPAAEEPEDEGFMTFAGAAIKPGDLSVGPPPEEPPEAAPGGTEVPGTAGEVPGTEVPGTEVPGVDTETAGEPAPAAPERAAETVVGSAEPVSAVQSDNGRRAASDFLPADSIRAAAEELGLRMPHDVYASLSAALASGKHVVLTGPPGSGKTTLALAVAKAAAATGRSSGAALVTAGTEWTGREHVLTAAERDRWLIIDELDRPGLDRALGDVSGFLAGLPLSLADAGEASPPAHWRVVGTAEKGLSALGGALLRRFARIGLPDADDGAVDAAISDAADGDPAAAGAARRLLAFRDVRPLGAGPFVDAARHAAERNAIGAVSESQLARECFEAYVKPHMVGLDEGAERRLEELVRAL